MISTDMGHPIQIKTVGELRQLIAHFADDTPLAIDDRYGEFPAPSIYFEAPESLLIFTEPFPEIL